jgi:chemotaxis protein MotB
MAKGDNKDDRSIIIKKEEVVEGGHHGGAWKLAYADFMTAMMAFFLLMWLVNMTTIEQKTGLADYFSPNNIMSRGSSGNGQPFGGHTPYDEGSLASDRGSVAVMNAHAPPTVETEDDDSNIPSQVQNFHDNGDAQKQPRRAQPLHPGGPMAKDAVRPGDGIAPGTTGVQNTSEAEKSPEALKQAEAEKREKIRFQQAAQQIKDAVAQDPGLSDLGKQLMVDITPDGLRIQLLDAEHQPMFPSGSTALTDRARALLLKVMPILNKLPEKVSFAGHTDAAPYRGGDRTNWELSADRANAVRHLFTDAGLPDNRVDLVTGHADRDPLVPSDPLAAVNRRIAIVVLRDAKLAPAPAAAPAPATPAANTGTVPSHTTGGK